MAHLKLNTVKTQRLCTASEGIYVITDSSYTDTLKTGNLVSVCCLSGHGTIIVSDLVTLGAYEQKGVNPWILVRPISKEDVMEAGCD